MSKLVSNGLDGNEYYYLFEDTTVDELGEKVNSYFESQDYKLEEGTPRDGVYGTGSAIMRVLFGAFAKRYKFKVEIDENGDRVRLAICEAMSGFSGGLIGKSKMSKEVKRITTEIKANL